MRIQSIAALALTFLLVACQTVKPEPEIRYKTVVIAPPDSLLLDCEQTQPPDLDTYATIPTYEVKEGVLVEVIKNQITRMTECNIRIRNLREWKAEKLKLYEEQKT